MIALCVIVGIILLFALLLTIRASISVELTGTLKCSVQWAFIKIQLYPEEEKKPKQKKEKKPKEEKEEEKEEEPKEKKEKSGSNPLKTFYNNQGLDGVIDLLSALMSKLDKMTRRIIHSFVLDNFVLNVIVAKGDAAETAISYGETCAKVFPLCGNIISKCNVKKYDINISPDYLAEEGNVEFVFKMSVIPRRLINAILLLIPGLVFGVVIKFIKGLKSDSKSTNKNNTISNTKSAESGVSQ